MKQTSTALVPFIAAPIPPPPGSESQDYPITYPQQHASAQYWQIPSRSYLREEPHRITEEGCYIYFTRHHRAQIVDVDINIQERSSFLLYFFSHCI